MGLFLSWITDWLEWVVSSIQAYLGRTTKWKLYVDDKIVLTNEQMQADYFRLCVKFNKITSLKGDCSDVRTDTVSIVIFEITSTGKMTDCV